MEHLDLVKKVISVTKKNPKKTAERIIEKLLPKMKDNVIVSGTIGNDCVEKTLYERISRKMLERMEKENPEIVINEALGEFIDSSEKFNDLYYVYSEYEYDKKKDNSSYVCDTAYDQLEWDEL